MSCEKKVKPSDVDEDITYPIQDEKEREYKKWDLSWDLRELLFQYVDYNSLPLIETLTIEDIYNVLYINK
tara:strand:- start:1897 stop:2106 length:210 start_codon:yes stop_codon:yes gene_type:complete